MTVRYPLEIEILHEHNTFKATVMLLFPKVKAKAFVAFVFDARTFSYWPMSLDSLRCDVQVAYGNVEYVSSPGSIQTQS